MENSEKIVFDLKRGISQVVASKNGNKTRQEETMKNFLSQAHKFLDAGKSVEELARILDH
jgi:hypothetical protein